jgi:hypothetical protein
MDEVVEIFRFMLACCSQSIVEAFWKPTSIAEKETELHASYERYVLHRRVLCREPVPEANEAIEANEANICFICFIICFNCFICFICFRDCA